MTPLPDWERVLTAVSHLQRIVPNTVVVGGTVAAIEAGSIAWERGSRMTCSTGFSGTANRHAIPETVPDRFERDIHGLRAAPMPV